VFAPPCALDALGAFGGDNLVQRAPPSKAEWRTVRHFGDGLDRLRLHQEAQGPRREIGVAAMPAEIRPAIIGAGHLGGDIGPGDFRNMAVLRDRPAHTLRTQPRAQAVGQAVELGAVFGVADADLFGWARLCNQHRQSRHVEAEAGIERVGECGHPLDKQRADGNRIAQRTRGAGGDAAQHAVGAK